MAKSHKRSKKFRYILSLDSKAERLWIDLKQKLKFKSDQSFLIFLLVYVKKNFSWCRKRKILFLNKKKNADSFDTKSKNYLLPIQSQHIGDKRDKIINHNHYSSLNPADQKLDLSSSSLKTKCDLLIRDHAKNLTNQQFIQAGLLTKISTNNVLLDFNDKDNVEPFSDIELLNTDTISKVEFMNLKVSELARSRFEDELENDLTTTETNYFNDKISLISSTATITKPLLKKSDKFCENDESSLKKCFYPLKSVSENSQDDISVCNVSDSIINTNVLNEFEKENYDDGVFSVPAITKQRSSKTDKTNTKKLVLNNVPQKLENSSTQAESGNSEVYNDVCEANVPDGFFLRITDLKHGPSVFTNSPVKAGEEIGPLDGIFVREMDIPEDSNMRNIWPVGIGENVRYLSTKDGENSNWLRHMRPADNEKLANCLTVTIKDRLFFRVTQDLASGDELLYWTSEIDPKWAKKRLTKSNCGGCNLQFGHTLYYRIHCMLFHDSSCSLNIRKYYCKICGVTVLGKDKIISHAVENHEGKGAYQCQFCHKFSRRLRHLELHRTYSCAKNPNRRNVKCDVCFQEFSQPQKLQTHQKRMHGDMEAVLKKFQCEHCKKILGTGAGLLRHKKEVHNKEIAAATCDRCGKVFQNKGNLKIHMLTHSGVKPFKCEEINCFSGFTTKQRLQMHYKKTHGMANGTLPSIQRTVEFTFDAYCGKLGNGDESEKGTTSPPPFIDENQSEGMSPLSVGCSADLPPLSVPRPDDFSEEEGTDVDKVEESRNCLGYNPSEGIPICPLPSFPSKGSRKWLGSPPLYRIDNYSASFLVEEAICAAEKDIEKDVMDVLPYDALPPYIGSPPLDEQRTALPRDYSANSPPLDESRDLLRSHLYPNVISPIDESNHVYQSTTALDESRDMLRTHILQRNYTPPPIAFKMNLPREYCTNSQQMEEQRDTLKTNSLLRDYNISSLIREDLQDAEQDCSARGLIDPGKDPEVSEYRSNLYRDESRDGLAEVRRAEFYRRDGYDVSYPVDGEAQNLSLKEKSLQLDLSYKGYEGLDEFDRIGRDTSGLDNLLVGDPNSQAMNRSLHLSPRYPPTYDAESMDLSLHRIPYPSSPIYSLDLPTRFDIPSGRLVDLRNHLGLSPHRFPAARVVPAGGSSPPASSFIYQPTFATPTARHSPTASYHPYSAYY